MKSSAMHFACDKLNVSQAESAPPLNHEYLVRCIVHTNSKEMVSRENENAYEVSTYVYMYVYTYVGEYINIFVWLY